MEKPKIFGVGFHKTGTSSLHQALKILGYNAIHGDPRYGPPYGDEGRTFIQQINNQDYNFSTLSKYDAFTDNPYFSTWRQLDERHPGSKFILTLRDENEWINSCVAFYRGRRIRPMREWMFGEYADPSSGDAAAQCWLKKYQEHNREIIEHFKDRPDDLLIFRITEGETWEPLCRFLQQPIPKQPFPFANSAASNVMKRNISPWRRSLKRLKGGLKRELYRRIDRWLKREVYFVVSHPKSGRTWLALALGKLLESKYAIPHHALIYPYAYLAPGVKSLPRIVFWHLSSNQILRKSRLFSVSKTHVIFLVRDPRDVVVSYFHQMTQRKVKFQGTVSTFIRDEKLGIAKIVAYMNFMMQQRGQFASFTMIQYEDMKKDLGKVLGKICATMNIEIDPAQIQQAVTWSSFDEMQAREKSGYYDARVKQLNARNIRNVNSYKIRKGKIGSFMEELTAPDIAFLNHYIEEHLDPAYEDYITGTHTST